jgi:glycosidase
VRFLTEANDDVEGMKLAILFQFTYPGTPFIYAGDELGMTGHSLICRCGLLWDESRQNSDLLAHYRLAGRLRKENPALSYGYFEEILVSDERGLFGFARRFKGEEIQVFFNVGSTEQLIEVTDDSFDLLNESPVMGAKMTLRPKSAAVLRRNF